MEEAAAAELLIVADTEHRRIETEFVWNGSSDMSQARSYRKFARI